MTEQNSAAIVLTAREQAREAVRTEDIRLECEGLAASVEHYANIASDVWEPLVRDLLTLAEYGASYDAKGEAQRVINRAREALGNGSCAQGGEDAR